MKRSILFILCLFCIGTILTVQAASYCDTRLNIDTGQSADRSHTRTLATGDQIRFVYRSALGGTAQMIVTWQGSQVAVLSVNQSHIQNISADGTYTFRVQSSDTSNIAFEISCVGSGSIAPSPTPDYVNWQYGSSIALVFPSDNGLDIYDISSEQYITSFLLRDDVDFLMQNPPANNLLVKQVGLVRVYILTTGELQLNFGPDGESKEWVIIMPNINGIGAYGYEVAP